MEHFGDQACAIRGGMTDKQKEKAKEEFQNKEKTVCVLNMQAGGVGHTLTAAHAMIIIDYAWIPSEMIQVEDRICRTGQDEHCMIYYVYCVNAIFDNLFIDMISNKSANIDLVVDNAQNTFDLSYEKDNSKTFIENLKEYIKNNSTVKKKQKTI